MKTTFWSKSILTGVALLAFTSVMVTGCKDDDVPVNNSPYTVTGNGSGNQAVPSNAGTGSSTLNGTYNPGNRQFIYTSNWNGLTGAPNTGGFYTGVTGANGPINGSAWTFDSTATGTGSSTDTITLTADQATQFLDGNWYYSYGTTAYPGGEVRGQINAVR